MSLSQTKTSLDTNACEQKRCIALQPVLKSEVWHCKKPNSQLCGPTTSAQAVSHETCICSHFLNNASQNRQPTRRSVRGSTLPLRQSCHCAGCQTFINLRSGSCPCRCLNLTAPLQPSSVFLPCRHGSQKRCRCCSCCLTTGPNNSVSLRLKQKGQNRALSSGCISVSATKLHGARSLCSSNWRKTRVTDRRFPKMNGLEKSKKEKATAWTNNRSRQNTFFWAIQTMCFHIPDHAFSCLLDGFVSFETFQECIVWIVAEPKTLHHAAER
jgi:hypothetical protein